MAYGSSELDVVATTTDHWIDGNGLDLLSGHSPYVAVMHRRSMEPGSDFAYMRGDIGGGIAWKHVAYWNVNTTVGGVTRANQVTAITPTVPGAGGAASRETTIKYGWSHYIGLVSLNYEDTIKNRGKEGIVDLSQTAINQCEASFFVDVATDLWDGAVEAADKVQSITHCLANTGSPGGVDQTDTTNNTPFRANTNSDTETFSLLMFSALRDLAVHDTAKPTGIRQSEPDAAFLANAVYSKAKNDMRPSQRTEVSDMLKGGCKYLQFDGVRLFREPNLTAGSGVILNTATWRWVYATEMPEPNAPGFIQDPTRPAMKTRGYNWMISTGCISPKHNGYFTNKAA